MTTLDMRAILIVAGAVVSSASMAQAFFNNTNVRVPGTGTGGVAGAPAGLYPITFVVSGVENILTDLNVCLNFGMAVGTVGVLLGEEHTAALDLDMMLISPLNTQLMLVSDVGGFNDFNGSYTIDDQAIAAIDISGTGQNTGGNLNNDSYRVSQFGTGDRFPSPAPAPNYTNVALAAFNGENPNGTWSLYIVDDFVVDAGWLMSSCLEIAAVPEPGTMIALVAGIGAYTACRRAKKR